MLYHIMIKPASSLCNLRCQYCFYADETAIRNTVSYGIMTPEVRKNMIQNIANQWKDGDILELSFQGGEPTMAGLPWFQALMEDLKILPNHQAVALSIQTNGYLLNDDWCSFFAKHHFLVGLSLDGEAKFHNENRVDGQGKGTYRKIMEAKACLEKHGVSYNILCVLTAHSARYPQRIWNWMMKEHISHIQFIPCLDGLDGEKHHNAALFPSRFAAFYAGLLPLWAKAFHQGQYISVRFFDDVFNLLQRRTNVSCGFAGGCFGQLVAEADGGVYPCDFYMLDQWKLGNLQTDNLAQLVECAKMEAFRQRPQGDNPHCKDCRFFSFCKGGCPRMQREIYATASDNDCGYRRFWEENAALIESVVTKLQQYR